MSDFEYAEELLIVNALVEFSYDRRERQPHRSKLARTLAERIVAEHELTLVDAYNELARLEAEGKA